MTPAIRFDPTPNPNAIKCVIGEVAGVQSTRAYRTHEQAADDPLAARLMSISGVVGLLIADGWFTVTKSPGASWKELRPAISRALADGR